MWRKGLLLLIFAMTLETARGKIHEREEGNIGIETSVEATEQSNVCCDRETKMKSLGLSATAEEIVLDVGHCRKQCSGKRLKKNEFQGLLLDNPDLDPRQVFLMQNALRRGPSCGSGYTCSPSETQVERLMTSEGLVSATMIEKCQCQKQLHSCSRTPLLSTLHKDTPLQIIVDVGECQGHCGHGLGCKPNKTKTISIEGPNGAECVSVIEDCECGGSCYRESYLQQYYNYDSEDEDIPRVEVIDVGVCNGECETVPEEHCLLRDSGGVCSMSLKKKTSRCAAVGLRYHNVTQKDGSTRLVSSITECGCQ